MPVEYSMKILLVEDSKFMRAMEVNMLHDLGYANIEEAMDAETAMSKLEQDENIKLIISDWNMPGKTGYDLLVWVRSHPKLKDIPFVIASGRGEKKETEKAIKAGVNDFIVKPFDGSELKNVIIEIFEGKKDEREKARLKRSASGKRLLNVAHIQITDHLVLGVLKHLIQIGHFKPKHFELKTTCMTTWNQVRKALEKNEVDAACILAPIAMNSFSCGAPIKLVLFAHKNGSIAVRKKRTKEETSLYDFCKGKSFCIPHQMSIHHMLSHMYFKRIGLRPGIDRSISDFIFEVIPPIKMPKVLASNNEVAGFMVAEPLGTKAIAEGSAELLFLSGELWKNHPCCVISMHDEVIQEAEEATSEFVELLARSGEFIAKNISKAAEIAVDFLDPKKELGLKVSVLKNVLEEKEGIKTVDLYPCIEDLDTIQKYMVNEMNIGTLIDLEKFVDLKFAKEAYKNRQENPEVSILNLDRIDKIEKERDDLLHSSKAMLEKEGEYLIFQLHKQDYGMEISNIKEIIRYVPIINVPLAPSYVKGLINLRGEVVTITDLRCKLGLNSFEYGQSHRIIIVKIHNRSGSSLEGFLVDSVSEVIRIKSTEIYDTKFDNRIDPKYIHAIATEKKEQKSIILLKMDTLV